jgi:hypothetical protein
MKRTTTTILLLAALAGVGPARADTTVSGHIDAANPQPMLARLAFLADEKLNGQLGYVVELPNPVDEERRFELRRVPGTGVTGLEDLDVYFYRAIEGTGDPCPYQPDSTSSGGETGTICAGASHAVVVLFAGADVDFELTIDRPSA